VKAVKRGAEQALIATRSFQLESEAERSERAGESATGQGAGQETGGARGAEERRDGVLWSSGTERLSSTTARGKKS
jgi:hypothetical protein